MYLGCHVSIAGGFDKCIDRIVERGGNCLMTFASSPRSLQTKQYSQTEIDAYLKKKSEHKIGPHFFHGAYLVNLASDKADHLQASIDSLLFYQQFAAVIGAIGTIFHIGSSKNSQFPIVKQQIVTALQAVVKQSPTEVKLLLENAAGQGETIGDNLEELGELISGCGFGPDKLAVCLDTQHAWASGYDLGTLVDRFDKIIGLNYLKVIHLNDSKTEFGSRVDRHENLGSGKIGRNQLTNFVLNPKLANIPFILEVPGDGDGPRKQDIDTLKKYRGILDI